MECIFCAIVKGEIPATKVYEDEKTLAFMDINPATDGHTLVIPKRHVENIYSLNEEDGEGIMRTTLRVSKAIKKALKPDGLNLVQANEKAGFQEVPHFHMHIIPRWFGDGLKPPWTLSPGDMEKIGELANRIKKEI
ncbi:MAG: HIT family protein [Candidatus Methanofastidiosia archaeon]